MPLRVVRTLRPGDRVHLWWAKDGNPRDVRCDGTYEVLDVAPIEGGVCLTFADGDIDLLNIDVERTPDLNHVEWGGRGPVYFSYPDSRWKALRDRPDNCGRGFGVGSPRVPQEEPQEEQPCRTFSTLA